MAYHRVNLLNDILIKKCGFALRLILILAEEATENGYVRGRNTKNNTFNNERGTT